MSQRFLAEFRSKTDGNRIDGYASVFGQYAQIGNTLEQVSNRAFNRALSENHDVRLLINHDPNLLLARSASGTLKLDVDKKGLRVVADLPDTSYAADLRTLMARGDLSQMSFGFRVLADSWSEVRGMQLRTIEDLELFDVSVVSFPAYDSTQVSLRSLEEVSFTQPDIDRATQLLVVRHNIRFGG